MYLSSDHYSSSYGITIGYLERFFSFIMIFLLSKKIIAKKEENIIFINLFYLYSFIFLFFSEIMVILERVTVLFVCSYWILYPTIYSFFSRNKKKIFLVVALFYGFLKIGQGNRTILSQYDNMLFGYKSYSERRIIINRYQDFSQK
jgi:hypothetical protein